MIQHIVKRDGRVVPYDINKIAGAIDKAMKACGRSGGDESMRIAKIVEERVEEDGGEPSVEQIQDVVENVLMECGYAFVANKYILYRAERTRARERNTKLSRIFDELTFADSLDSNIKRDNANVDGDTAMGVMLKYGSESAKDYYIKSILAPEQSKAHMEGDIHIHDLDFYTLTTTCCQIDLIKLFKNGFSTGHGHLREPNDISSYSALACIAIQSNQNDQHGGQSIVNFDYGLAPGVAKTYKKRYVRNMQRAAEIICPELPEMEIAELINKASEVSGKAPALDMPEEYVRAEAELLEGKLGEEKAKQLHDFAKHNAERETDRATFQSMEALVHT